MNHCPICQSPNQLNEYNCHYCGASLRDRKHKAPSQAAPVLITRPSAQFEVLGLNTVETPEEIELSTLQLTMDSSEGDALFIESQETDSRQIEHSNEQDEEGESWVVKTPIPITVSYSDREEAVAHLTPAHLAPNNEKVQEQAKPNVSYTPMTMSYSERSASSAGKAIIQENFEPRFETIDEASDGLGPLDVDLAIEEPLFPSEPRLGSNRPQSRLSDLSGMNSLSSSGIEVEPSFDSLNSRPAQTQSQSALAALQAPTITLEERVEQPTSLLLQGVIFAFCTLGVLWGLGFDDSIRELISLQMQDRPAQPIILKSNKEMKHNSANLVVVNSLPSQQTEDLDSSISTNEETDEQDIVFDEVSVNQNQAIKQLKEKNTQSTASRVASKKEKPFKKKSNQASRASYQSYMKRGERMLMNGNVKQAEVQFKQAQQLKPNQADPLSQLAWCALAKNNATKAIGQFKRALTINPIHGDSLYGLGYSYEKMKDSKNALRYFELYLNRYPTGSKVSVIKNKMRRLKP